jgi:hypothetical protein
LKNPLQDFRYPTIPNWEILDIWQLFRKTQLEILDIWQLFAKPNWEISDVWQLFEKPDSEILDICVSMP